MCLSVLNFICVNMSCTFVLVCVVGITSLLLSALEDRFLLFALLYIYYLLLLYFLSSVLFYVLFIFNCAIFYFCNI